MSVICVHLWPIPRQHDSDLHRILDTNSRLKYSLSTVQQDEVLKGKKVERFSTCKASHQEFECRPDELSPNGMALGAASTYKSRLDED